MYPMYVLMQGGRPAMFSCATPMGVDPRSIAQRIMEIRCAAGAVICCHLSAMGSKVCGRCCHLLSSVCHGEQGMRQVLSCVVTCQYGGQVGCGCVQEV